MKRISIPALFFIVAFASTPVTSFAAPVQWKTEDGGNGHWYELVMPDSYLDSFTWTEARTAAEAGGGYLATVTSQAENDFLGAHFSSSLYDNSDHFGSPPPFQVKYAWIGLYAPTPNAPFQWVTGEPFSYSNWALDEPNFPNTPQWQYVHYWTRNHFGEGATWEWNNDGNEGFEVLTGQNTHGYIVETVPEPSSLTLLGCAFGLLMFAMRFKRRPH